MKNICVLRLYVKLFFFSDDDIQAGIKADCDFLKSLPRLSSFCHKFLTLLTPFKMAVCSSVSAGSLPSALIIIQIFPLLSSFAKRFFKKYTTTWQ